METKQQATTTLNNIDIYRLTNGITFILTEEKTIVHTGHQTFMVKYDHRNYSKRLRILRELIRIGMMQSLPDLITFCGYRPGGYKDQMCGLELIPTRLERHI